MSCVLNFIGAEKNNFWICMTYTNPPRDTTYIFTLWLHVELAIPFCDCLFYKYEYVSFVLHKTKHTFRASEWKHMNLTKAIQWLKYFDVSLNVNVKSIMKNTAGTKHILIEKISKSTCRENFLDSLIARHPPKRCLAEWQMKKNRRQGSIKMSPSPKELLGYQNMLIYGIIFVR